MIKKYFYTILFGLLFIASNALGADQGYYIDSSAGGGGTGTIGSPFNELSDIGTTQWNQLASWASSGDDPHIYLKAGSTFHPGALWSFNASGASGHPIHVVRYSTGNDPIIDWDNTYSTGLEINARSYITFDQIKFDDATAIGILIHGGGTGYTFIDCYVTHTSALSYQQHGIVFRVNDGNLSAVSIQNTTFYRLNDGIRIEYTGNISTDMDNFTVDGCTFSVLTNGIHNYVNDDGPYDYQVAAGARTSNFVATDNYFHDLYNDAIIMNCKGGSNLISGNVLIDIGTGGQKTNALQLGHCENLIVEWNYINGVNAADGGDSHGIILDHYKQGQTGNDCNGVIVRYNYITNCTDQSGSRGIRVWDSQNAQIYGNVLVNNNGGIALAKANSGNVFYNNTIIQATGSCVVLTTGTYEYTGTAIFKNNICQNGDYFFEGNASGTITESYNLYYILDTAFTNKSGLSADPTDINANPLFVGSGANVYALQESSPAVGAGMDWGTADGIDPDGANFTTNPVTAASLSFDTYGYTIGAYIYPSEEPPPSGLVTQFGPTAIGNMTQIGPTLIADVGQLLFWGISGGAPYYTYLGSNSQPADSDNESGQDNTYVFDEASPVTGYIVRIEMYIYDAGSGTVDFAVFSKSGTSFTDEHAVSGLAVTTGYNVFTHAGGDFDATNLPISAGEYIGWYLNATGNIDKDSINGRGPGYWYDSGDQISGTPAATTYTLSPNTTHENQIRVYISSVDPVDP